MHGTAQNRRGLVEQDEPVLGAPSSSPYRSFPSVRGYYRARLLAPSSSNQYALADAH